MKNSYVTADTNMKHQNLRLIIVQNDDDDTGNLFVRLPLKTATDLSATNCDIGFIPLSISILDNTIYTSWNGGLLTDYSGTSLMFSFKAKTEQFSFGIIKSESGKFNFLIL